MKRTLIFDLDGTLVDSMPFFAKGILKVLEDEGIEHDKDEIISIVTPLGYTKSAEYYKTIGVKGSTEEIVRKIENNLVNEYANNIKLKPGIDKYLRKMKNEGAGLYVLTASPHIVTDICLKNNGVYDLFDEVWSVEDFGLSKSGTELFFVVADRLGAKPGDIEFFDDNLTAVINSSKAGYVTYAVMDRHTEEEFSHMASFAKYAVKTFEDM